MKNTLQVTARFTWRALALSVMLLLVLPWVLLGVTASRSLGHDEWHRKLVNGWSQQLLRVFGLSIRHHGTPRPDPAFIVANHVSWLDIPVIHSAKVAGFVAKAEIASWPLLGWVVKCGDTVFHQRGKSDSRQRVLQALEEKLVNGKSVAVFPEGKTTPGDSVGRFHRQLLRAAVDTGCAIQPVAIEYWGNNGMRNTQLPFCHQESFLHNVWRLLKMPAGCVQVHWLAPLPTSTQPPPRTRELADQARECILQQMRQDGYLDA